MNTRLYKKKSYKGLLLKDLSHKKSLRKEVRRNNIYILFRNNDAKLKLVINEVDKILLLSKGYQLIGSRPGSKRELDLAKLTLNELLLNRKKEEVSIDLSRELIKHLEILGYSNKSPNKVNKKYII